MSSPVRRVPVVALAGYLGAGKTTVLNHLLRTPDARVGVVVNDFGDINVDATLIRGQVDRPASISGGCICCLDDAGGLDEAMEQLTHPRLALDVVVVEASGLAEPAALAHLIRYSGVEHVRPAGLVEVVDAVHHDVTTLTSAIRFRSASLVVVNKCDLVAGEVVDGIETQAREVNPYAHVVRARRGAVDPALVFDVDRLESAQPELPFGDAAAGPTHHHDHAASASIEVDGPIDPDRLVDLLESPPPHAYRVKGTVVVATGAQRTRTFVVNVVGSQVHVAPAPTAATSTLVAIGVGMDAATARAALEDGVRRCDRAVTAGLRRLRRHRRLSD